MFFWYFFARQTWRQAQMSCTRPWWNAQRMSSGSSRVKSHSWLRWPPTWWWTSATWAWCVSGPQIVEPSGHYRKKAARYSFRDLEIPDIPKMIPRYSIKYSAYFINFHDIWASCCHLTRPQPILGRACYDPAETLRHFKTQQWQLVAMGYGLRFITLPSFVAWRRWLG